MKDKSVQLCCFSPPYWGLRKYSVKPLIWGGDSECRHEWGKEKIVKRGHPGDQTTLVGTQTADIPKAAGSQGQFCQLCGAWRGDLGLEPTPELYLDHMMLVMAECWRVLRDDGVCFVNIGDSYASRLRQSGEQYAGELARSNKGQILEIQRPLPANLREKSLCLIPQKFAIRCQQAGWIIRSEIIWAKPNPMPESVKDRPTRSHEQVWLMVKQGKYYWDQDAVREEQRPETTSRYAFGFGSPKKKANLIEAKSWHTGKDGRDNLCGEIQLNPAGRNIRDVWTMATQPTPEAHFATWPMELCDKMIRAASKLGDIVLDPFCGTANTVLKAEELNRIGVGIDLSWEYISDIAKVRYDRPLQRELYVH